MMGRLSINSFFNKWVNKRQSFLDETNPFIIDGEARIKNVMM